MRLAVCCYLALRIAIAATLAYALLPEVWFVATASALDAFAALLPKRQRLVIYEAIARVLLLCFASRCSGVLMGRAHGGDPTWFWGRFGVVLIAFAPMAIGHWLRWLLLSPWANPRVPDAERQRRSLLAVGCCVIVVSLCVPRLLRMPMVRNVAIVSAFLGSVFLLAGAVRRVARPTPDAPYRSPPTARTPPQRWGLRLFAGLAVSGTLMFDAACWHGSGWIPTRHELDADRLLAPIYHSEERLVEWTGPFDPPRHLFWKIDDTRFETERELFVRMVKHNNPPTTLAYFIPWATRPQECEFVLEKIGPNTRPHERDLVFDPYVRDVQLHFTCRRPDRGLAYCSIGLDGTWTGCTAS